MSELNTPEMIWNVTKQNHPFICVFGIATFSSRKSIDNKIVKKKSE